MIGATEKFAGIAILIAHQLTALVRAAVVEHAHLAITVAHHQQLASGDIQRFEIACVRHLAGMAHILPGPGKKTLLLQLEQCLTQIEVTMNSFILHQAL